MRLVTARLRLGMPPSIRSRLAPLQMGRGLIPKGVCAFLGSQRKVEPSTSTKGASLKGAVLFFCLLQRQPRSRFAYAGRPVDNNVLGIGEELAKSELTAVSCPIISLILRSQYFHG